MSDSHLFSPAYVFNQLTNGGSGIHIANALNLLVDQGACTLADMPYNQDDFLTQPTNAQRISALPHKAKDWISFYIPDEPTLAKMVIRIFGGAVVTAPAYPDFFDISDGNKIFDNLDNPDNKKVGNHAICLIGYDDDLRAYKFINSWGTEWGLNGYGYIAYDLFERLSTNLYFMFDEKEAAGNKGYATGQVKDGNNNPIACTINIINSKGNLLFYNSSGSDGKFNIELPVGTTATALKNHPKQPLKAVHDSWYPSPLICGAFSG